MIKLRKEAKAWLCFRLPGTTRSLRGRGGKEGLKVMRVVADLTGFCMKRPGHLEGA